MTRLASGIGVRGSVPALAAMDGTDQVSVLEMDSSSVAS